MSSQLGSFLCGGDEYGLGLCFESISSLCVHSGLERCWSTCLLCVGCNGVVHCNGLFISLITTSC